MVFDAVCARSAHDVWARSPAANQRRIYIVKTNKVRFLANIFRALRFSCALRSSDEARAMFGVFNTKFMQSDVKGVYHSPVYDIPGMSTNSNPLHLMSLLATMWRCDQVLTRAAIVFFVFLVSVLGVVIFTALAHLVANWILPESVETKWWCFFVGLLIGGNIAFDCFNRTWSHDRKILKIVTSYGPMIHDFCESLVVADVRAIWTVGEGWTICEPSIDEVRSRAIAYLDSWALWVIYNESVDSHSDETGKARSQFAQYHRALERIGLVHDGFTPFYDRAKSCFETEFASSGRMLSKPVLRQLPEQVSAY